MTSLFATLFGSIALLVTLASAPVARADTASGQVTLAQVEDVLSEYREFVYFCQDCGETVPGVPFMSSGKITALARGRGEVALVIGGREFAAQHLYARTEPGWFRNVAVLLDLSRGDVTPSLRVDRVGTSGELITADLQNEPPEPPTEPVASFVGETPAVEPAVNAPSTDHPTRCGMPSFLMSFAALLLSGGLVFTVFGFLFVNRRRRGKAVLPRAIHLPK